MSQGQMLSVSEVRAALRQAAGLFPGHGGGEGTASLAMLGTIFHECAAKLRWQDVLDESRLLAADAPDVLAAHVYGVLLAPRLERRQGVLAQNGAEVWELWQAVQAFCRWLVEVLRKGATEGLLRFDAVEQRWAGVEEIFEAEMPLRWVVPGVRPPLVIEGEADAVWRDPRTNRWCVLEFKVGKGAPELDLAQACLYQELLRSSREMGAAPAVCLLRFQPEMEQLVFTPEQTAEAQSRLLEFVKTLAESNRNGAVPVISPAEAGPYEELGKDLVAALGTLGLEVTRVGAPVVGPSYVRYELMPAPKTRKKSIVSRAEDLQIRMGLRETPTIKIDQGKLVADLARRERETVRLSAVLERLAGREKKGMQVLLGVDLPGEVQMVDLADSVSPHLLIAGGPGSGKSEWMKSALASAMARYAPDEVRFVLVDPKYTAFAGFADSPYLWNERSLVFPQEHSVVTVLEELIAEMESRYQRFGKVKGVADLTAYREKGDEAPPRILFCCDEYADLLSDKKQRDEVRGAVQRLGQKARAAGIHLLLATQSPRAEVVDGIIKANLPARVCLRVNTSLDSRVVMDQAGAERLLGNGDLYYTAVGQPVRLQGAFCDV
jgi:DNA segregation ATPase FtsK/SpoIIIE, S-DNA-T family